MVEGVRCTYCGKVSYTSSPRFANKCSYCSKPFAELLPQRIGKVRAGIVKRGNCGRNKDEIVKIAPSLLAADFRCLGEEISDMEEAGADLLHIDVMDGHFVPNITIGIPVVASLKGSTRLPLDVHLMIDNPYQFVEPFAQAGADIITFHIEVVPEPKEIIKAIKGYGVKVGLALKPHTPLSKVEPVLNSLDMILLMTVNPGFGGQDFMPEVIPKIRELRRMREEGKLFLDIEVDGGINRETARQVISAGANVLVAGTAIFAEPDRKSSLRALRT